MSVADDIREVLDERDRAEARAEQRGAFNAFIRTAGRTIRGGLAPEVEADQDPDTGLDQGQRGSGEPVDRRTGRQKLNDSIRARTGFYSGDADGE